MVVETGLVVAALAPYLHKLGETAADKLGEAAPKAVGQLYSLIKNKLAGSGKEKALQHVEAEPDNPKKQGALEYVLEEAIATDPHFAAQLKALMDALPKGDTGGDQTATVNGDNNTTAQASGSNISINIGGRD